MVLDETLSDGDPGHEADHEALHARYNLGVPLVAADLTAHEAAANPHATYLTAAEGNAAYEVVGAVATHAAAGNPHPTYLTQAEGDAAYEAAGGIATHAAAADPHTGYQKESEKAAASGYASLDSGVKVPLAQLPTGTSSATVALGDAAAALIVTHEAAADPHTGYVKESLIDAAGDLIVGSADNAVARLAKGADGTFLGVVAGSLAYAAPAGGGDTYVYKSADESVTSSTTLQDDNHLVFAIAANEIWVAEYTIFLEGPIAGNVKFGWTTPTTPDAVRNGFIGLFTTAGDQIGSVYMGSAGTAATGNMEAHPSGLTLRLFFFIDNSTNAGNVQLQWAQSVSDGTALTLKKGSYLTAHKLA